MLIGLDHDGDSYAGALYGLWRAFRGPTPEAVAVALVRHAEAVLWDIHRGRLVLAVASEGALADLPAIRVRADADVAIAVLPMFGLWRIGGTFDEAVELVRDDAAQLAERVVSGRLSLRPHLLAGVDGFGADEASAALVAANAALDGIGH